VNDFHPRHRVADVGPCVIEQCDCGVLHVTVGMMTMRLHGDTARALSIALDRALRLCEGADPVLSLAALGD
jgi:hypothetical protein